MRGLQGSHHGLHGLHRPQLRLLGERLLNVFAQQLDDILAQPGFGTPATYQPSSGAGVDLVVLEARTEPELRLLDGTRMASPALRVTLRVADVANRPADGDRLTIGGTPYVIRSAEGDEVGVGWRCDCDPA